MEQLFPDFWKRVQHRIVMPKVSEISYPEFPFYLIFIPEFPEFSVEWFAFRTSSEFLIERKALTDFPVQQFIFHKILT